jgi:hypothetical protein
MHVGKTDFMLIVFDNRKSFSCTVNKPEELIQNFKKSLHWYDISIFATVVAGNQIQSYDATSNINVIKNTPPFHHSY